MSPHLQPQFLTLKLKNIKASSSHFKTRKSLKKNKTKIWSCVLTGPETMNDFACECQRQFTGLETSLGPYRKPGRVVSIPHPCWERVDVTYHNIHREKWKTKNYKANSGLTDFPKGVESSLPSWYSFSCCRNLPSSIEPEQSLPFSPEPPLVSILSQINLVHTSQQHFLTVDSCMTATSTFMTI
jgi:hypothetical protein